MAINKGIHTMFALFVNRVVDKQHPVHGKTLICRYQSATALVSVKYNPHPKELNPSPLPM
jgi:hypothetical protein